MINVPGHPELRRIVVLNPKGGSGKSTLATSLAGYLVATGKTAALLDFDPQGSTIRWVRRRPEGRPAVYGISASEQPAGVTRSFHLRIPHEYRHVVIDTPAAVPSSQLASFTSGAHAILVPVLPSQIDIDAASRLVADLLLIAKLSRRMGRLGIVANRLRDNTVAFRRLMSFLDRLSIPVVATLRDSQNYVHAAEEGLSIHELPASRVRKDLVSWLPLTRWLESRLETPLTARDRLLPVTAPAQGRVVNLDDHRRPRA